MPRVGNGTLSSYITNLIKSEPRSECIIWPFHKRKGYAGFVRNHDGMTGAATVIVCRIRRGPKPTPRHEVAHSCGNGGGGCINPEHMRWATHRENILDKMDHGTMPVGERNPAALLTEASVREIMALRGTGSAKSIASRYGVSRETVSHIHNGRKWSHLFT